MRVVGVCCCAPSRPNSSDWKARDEEMMRKERKKKGVSFAILVAGDDGWSFRFNRNKTKQKLKFG